MALATCRDCNREVSTLARHCVHCGRPRPAGLGSGSLVAGIGAAVLALLLTGAVICAARNKCRSFSMKSAAECRLAEPVPAWTYVKISPADKANFIDSIQSEETELIEVRPGLYKVRRVPKAPAEAPAPAAPAEPAGPKQESF